VAEGKKRQKEQERNKTKQRRVRQKYRKEDKLNKEGSLGARKSEKKEGMGEMKERFIGISYLSHVEVVLYSRRPQNTGLVSVNYGGHLIGPNITFNTAYIYNI
jgi:hypothetical protein